MHGVGAHVLGKEIQVGTNFAGGKSEASGDLSEDNPAPFGSIIEGNQGCVVCFPQGP